MSIFTVGKLVEKIDEMDLGQAKVALKKIATRRHSQTEFDQIAGAIMGLDEFGKPSYLCNVSENKTISYSLMEKLKFSPLMEYLELIIQAAMDPHGPYQTREIMVLAADKVAHGRPYYMEFDDVPKTEKVMCGYLLQMAGFDFVSLYDSDRKMPVKVWKSRYGWGQADAKARAKKVRQHIELELQKIEALKEQDLKPLRLDDLI